MIDQIVLQIAKNAILTRFNDEYILNREELLENYPFLNSDGATFITLHYDGQLRGCIGSIIAHRALIEDIIHNSLSSAFNDSRFKPLTPDELSHITLEVSLLSEPKLLEYRDYNDLQNKIQPNIDGLILKYNGYQGTFLPQVWEQLPSPKEFLDHLSIKAGANPSIYTNHPIIYRYQVDAIEEKFDEILPL